MGRVYRDAEDLAAEAVYLALEDAGLREIANSMDY